MDLGYTSALDYLNGPVTTAYSRFLKHKTHENALEVAKLLWELRDWSWQDAHPKVDPRQAREDYTRFTDQLLTDCPDLGLVRDIAEGAKHGGHLGRATATVTAITGAGSPGGTLHTFGPLGMSQSEPVCTLAIERGNEPKRLLLPVLEGITSFWRDRLSQQRR